MQRFEEAENTARLRKTMNSRTREGKLFKHKHTCRSYSLGRTDSC